jgi:hypothetical protein
MSGYVRTISGRDKNQRRIRPSTAFTGASNTEPVYKIMPAEKSQAAEAARRSLVQKRQLISHTNHTD